VRAMPHSMQLLRRTPVHQEQGYLIDMGWWTVWHD
jgi:hypothetical protein